MSNDETTLNAMLKEGEVNTVLAPVTSNQIVWIIQPADNKFNKDGYKIMYRTDGELNKSTNITTTDTMDSSVQSAGSRSEDVSFSAYVVPRDTGLKILEYCRMKSLSVKVWRINLGDFHEGGGEGEDVNKGYLTDFMYGLVEDIGQSESNGEKVQLSVSIKVHGDSVKGRYELPEDVVNTALYGFEKPSEWVGDIDDPNRKKTET